MHSLKLIKTSHYWSCKYTLQQFYELDIYIYIYLNKIARQTPMPIGKQDNRKQLDLMHPRQGAADKRHRNSRERHNSASYSIAHCVFKIN